MKAPLKGFFFSIKNISLTILFLPFQRVLLKNLSSFPFLPATAFPLAGIFLAPMFKLKLRYTYGSDGNGKENRSLGEDSHSQGDQEKP
jgi:uncharacterized membrane protein